MKKHPYQFFARRTLKTISIVLGSMTVAFVIGIETAGDVDPLVAPTKAGDVTVSGDFNGDGTLSIADVNVALEIVRGNLTATPQHLSADPNGDFHITMDDIASMIETIEINTAE